VTHFSKSLFVRRPHRKAGLISYTRNSLETRVNISGCRIRCCSCDECVRLLPICRASALPYRGSEFQLRHKNSARSAFLCAGPLAASLVSPELCRTPSFRTMFQIEQTDSIDVSINVSLQCCISLQTIVSAQRLRRFYRVFFNVGENRTGRFAGAQARLSLHPVQPGPV
jgi:hypothetical protein